MVAMETARLRVASKSSQSRNGGGAGGAGAGEVSAVDETHTRMTELCSGLTGGGQDDRWRPDGVPMPTVGRTANAGERPWMVMVDEVTEARMAGGKAEGMLVVV